MQRGDLSKLDFISRSGCDKKRISDAAFGPLVGSGQLMPLVADTRVNIVNDQSSWVYARTISQRATVYNTDNEPTLMNDQYGSFVVGLRFEAPYSRVRIDCVDFKWDTGTPWAAPYPANTSEQLEVLGPQVQFRIRLGLNFAGFDPAVDLTWQPPNFAVGRYVSDYGSLVTISGIPFDSVLIYCRIPQNQQGFTQSLLQALAGFQVYVDLGGSTSRVLADCGQYATITSMQRSFERNTNLP